MKELSRSLSHTLLAIVMLNQAISLLFIVGAAMADTPANCSFEDIRGTWTFFESERSGDNTLNCDTLGPIVYTQTFTLDFPNTVMDEIGNKGTWTMIWNQGFEVNVNERSYFAFSYYEGNFSSATSYCDRTFNGWSRDTTVRNWSCFSANKTTKVPPHESKMSPSIMELHQMYRTDHEMIERINSKQSSWRAKAYPEHEKHTVMEMMNMMGGPASVLRNPPPPAPATPEQRERVSYLPENFDWRNVEGNNYVSPVRNQGGCGSCYAFAALGQIESRIRIATNNRRQDVFSTQDVVSCSVLSQGCTGGFNYLIAGRYAEDQGVVAEKCNPYIGKDAPCETDTSCARTFVSNYEYVGGFYGACNEEEMLQKLVEKGPLAVAFAVCSDITNYHGGIYHHTGERNTFNPLEYVDHAVLVVGYGVNETTGEKYWIVKNSWGETWGEDGYFRIRRGTNECSIESMALDITVIP